MATVFRPLNNAGLEAIRNCFNESFKDYFIPFYLNAEQFKNKLATEAIDLSLSFGVFENDQLAGFILNGIDSIDGIRIAYNAGTGVLPQYRGRGLCYALYEYGIGQLREAAVERSVLEVFQQNTQAIKTYQKAGFAITRNINSYKGRPAANISGIEIKEESEINWAWISRIAAWKPAWQYNSHTLLRGWHQYRLFITSEKEMPAAFVIFNSTNGRIALFGTEQTSNAEVHLAALFSHVSNLYEQDISVAHVESAGAEIFLQEIGLQPFIYSYEMERMI